MPRFPANQMGLQHQQRGFSLIEALFSALILGIALLGLAGFHAVALKDGSLVKARSVGANLAQQKLDDLRSFTRLRDDGNLLNGDECAAGTFCFSEIVASTADVNVGGGQENGNALWLPSGAASGYTDNYSVAWTVTCSPDTAGAAVSFGTACTDAAAKLATVTTSWTDSKGDNQFVALQGVIYGLDPAKSALAAGSSFSTEKPVVGYTPNGDSVPIEIGGGKSTETSKPLPEVSGGDSKRVTLPSVVYTGSAGAETLVSQEEFTTVNCTCALQASQATAWTPHRTVWNGRSLEQEKGEQVTKTVGQPNDLVNGTTRQDPLCIECCRDHHDTNLDTDGSNGPDYPAYRPYVALAEFLNSGDHKHYQADGTIAGAGDVYVEACRLKRVDGFWRVAADWQLVDLATYGCDYLYEGTTSECPPSSSVDPAKQTIYKTWVQDVLQDFVHYMDTNKSVNTVSTALPLFTSSVAPLLDNTDGDDDINVVNGGNKQLIARGIYVDAIFKKKSSGTPRAVDADYVAAVLPVYSNNDFDKLQYLPFYDANLTLLANWSPTSVDTAGSSDVGDCSKASPSYGSVTPAPTSAVCVTSEAIDTIDDPLLPYYDDFYTRGKIYGKQASGSTLITAKVARGNNGLTSSASINGTADVVKERQVKATIPGTTTTAGVSGTVIRGNSGATLDKITITASPSSGVSCVFTSPGTLATESAADYSCDVPSWWNGTLTFGDTAATTYTFSPDDTTSTIAALALVPDVTVYGGTLSLYGRLYAKNAVALKNVVIEFTSTGQTAQPCSVVPGTSVFVCAGLPLGGANTWIGTVTIRSTSNRTNVAKDVVACSESSLSTVSTALTAGPGDLGSLSDPTAFIFCAE